MATKPAAAKTAKKRIRKPKRRRGDIDRARNFAVVTHLFTGAAS